VTVQPSSIADLIKEAERLDRVGRYAQVVDLYKIWLASNPGDKLQHAAYFNYAVALAKNGDRAGAINTLRECIRLRPDFYPPYINLGRLLEDSGQAGSAVAQWLALVNTLVAVTGDAVRHKLIVLQQLGRVLEGAHHDSAAEDALRQSLDIKVDQREVIQHWIALRQRQCKWPIVEGWEGAPSRTLMANISPLSAAVLLDDPMFQLARNYAYARETIAVPASFTPVTKREPGSASGRRLRIGYVSSDLREHAVGFGLTEVMELPDRAQFEIHAYYCGLDRTDATKERIRSNVEHWTDINGLSDHEAAKKIAEDEIDILIDLNGYTRDARTAVFARRPAPVIANWFGFPGTMGTPYHHYIIGDEHVIPPGDEIYYSERVLRLPCYQPNDRKRPVADPGPSRADEGLPEDAFVFCCLNGTQKITPGIFQLWMGILGKVPNSVLWLLGATSETNARLKQMAEHCGVSGDRLIFAEKRPNPEHLARYRLADLFLDTHPYGAHTTAADAMWMGVPILTIPGRSFASRVCAGLLRAAGVPDLVCPTAHAYFERAVDLGLNPEKAAAIRQVLTNQRETSLLFDTPQLVRSLEGLYREMWSDFESGSLPVPDLTNLDVYGEIGTDLNLEATGDLTIEEYRARYLEQLRHWDKGYPLRLDERFWTEASRAAPSVDAA